MSVEQSAGRLLTTIHIHHESVRDALAGVARDHGVGESIAADDRLERWKRDGRAGQVEFVETRASASAASTASRTIVERFPFEGVGRNTYHKLHNASYIRVLHRNRHIGRDIRQDEFAPV